MPIAPAAIFLQSSLAVRAIAARWSVKMHQAASSVGEFAGVNASRLVTQPTMHAALLSMLVYVGEPDKLHCLHESTCIKVPCAQQVQSYTVANENVDGGCNQHENDNMCFVHLLFVVLRCQTNLNIALSCASVCRTCMCYLHMRKPPGSFWPGQR